MSLLVCLLNVYIGVGCLIWWFVVLDGCDFWLLAFVILGVMCRVFYCYYVGVSWFRVALIVL